MIHKVNHLNSFNYRHPKAVAISKRTKPIIFFTIILLVFAVLLGSCGMPTVCGNSKKVAKYKRDFVNIR